MEQAIPVKLHQSFKDMYPNISEFLETPANGSYKEITRKLFRLLELWNNEGGDIQSTLTKIYDHITYCDSKKLTSKLKAVAHEIQQRVIELKNDSWEKTLSFKMEKERKTKNPSMNSMAALLSYILNLLGRSQPLEVSV